MCKIAVAPLVGAWIEISVSSPQRAMGSVAPLVGAWIEIAPNMDSAMLLTSLPLWERGLKFVALPRSERVMEKSLPLWERGLKSKCKFKLIAKPGVAPLVGAWIEIIKLTRHSSLILSLPLWERGLKYPVPYPYW